MPTVMPSARKKFGSGTATATATASTSGTMAMIALSSHSSCRRLATAGWSPPSPPARRGVGTLISRV